MISIFGLSLVYVLHHRDDLTTTQSIVAYPLSTLLSNFTIVGMNSLTILYSMVLIVVVALLAIPIFGLTGFHMVLVARGRTTNEQVTGKFKGGYNPFSRGCARNCCYTHFGPQFPR